MGSPTTASRRLARLLGTLLPVGLAAALVVVPATPDAGSTVPSATVAAMRPAAAALRSATYTTFTLNIKHDLRKKQALADMRKALTLGDAGGFQEMSELEDRQSLMKLCNEKDWGWYMPTDGGVAIPIVWDRQRFRLIDGKTIRTHGPENGVTPSRYINVVRLRELATGKVFGYINTHTISQASRDAQASNMHLIPRLRKHLRLLRAEIVKLFGSTEHVFVSGDLNVNYLADRRRRVAGLPTDELGDLVNFDMPLQGSRGPTSLLDYGMTLKAGSGLWRNQAQIVRGFNSDHDAVVFDYRPVDLFETGPLFNLPVGTVPDRHRVLDRQARAVMDAEPGDLVRLVTSRLDDPVLADALRAAAAEGVQVRVLLGGGHATGAEKLLQSALGSDSTAPSWLVRCVGSCLGGAGRQQTNFTLVSHAGGTTNLTLVASAASDRNAAGRWNDTYRTAAPSVYETYGTIFDRMALDSLDTTKQRVLEFGIYKAQLYPVPAIPRRDPVLKALAAVGCKNADGLRTADGRTNVRVAVQDWSGDRGRLIAQRLAVLKTRGCDVAAVLGTKVLGGIRGILDGAGIATRFAATGQNLLVVDGRYGKRSGAHYAWTGGPSWSDRAFSDDGVTLVVPNRSAVKAYLDGFTRAWRLG